MSDQSLSDRSSYRDCCNRIISDDDEFAKFKTSKQIIDIIETISYENGLKFLNHIVNNNMNKMSSKTLDCFATLDAFGHPYRYNYGVYGITSPTNLRYLSVMGDIERIHGGLEDKVVVEIGSGWGGQSILLKTFYNIKKYIIIDLPEVIELNKKCIAYSNLNLSEYEFYSSYDVLSEDIVIDSDYVISNYAFSECYRSVQEKYIQNIINKTKQFYMTCNFFTEKDMLTLSEIQSSITIPNSCIEEAPLTSMGNLLLYSNI